MLISLNKDVQNITLDDLYRRAKEYGFSVRIEEDYYGAKHKVELKYINANGSTFWFKGQSMNSLIEAFFNAFLEAKSIGKSYD